MVQFQFPRHPQVLQDAADAALVLHRLLIDLRVVQDLLQQDVLRLHGPEEALPLHNRIQPLGDVARLVVQVVQLETEILLVLAGG